VIDQIWKDQLAALVQKDFQLREIFNERGVLNDCYHKELEKLQIANAEKLKKMILKYGFPVLSNAGDEGVRLSWLIIQHAISLPSFMLDSLFEMRLAAGQNDYTLELLAHTEDLVAFLQGRPQIYGTHLDWIDGEFRPSPILDPDFLQARRKSLGLPPLNEDSWALQAGRPPKDPITRIKEFQAWRVRVGWQF
jgi:hypothetical protein